ncbi:MAG: M1 family aminopeptidase, partial [candidate division Zixibacteria bacterium]
MGPIGGTIRAAYWYPQVCVYDRVVGWANSQYLGWGETYGDFGSFDVRISAPEEMIVAATGICVNERDVLSPELRTKLDISNFIKPRSEWPEFDFDPDQNKTWHYVAENVPDFVFTASANFCIDSDSTRSVEVVAYPLRHKAKRWQSAVLYGKQSIVTFSDLFLPYQWPVMRICDAFGGMEYPMLTNCSGGAPSPRFALLLYHEIGHQWFMGHIGSNQTDRPFLDEGFTTHAEHIAMEKYLGKGDNLTNYRDWYGKKFGPDVDDRNERGFRPLLLLTNAQYDKPLVFSYDQGEEYWPFRVSAYYKTAAMHYALRSILSDSAYFEAMQHYCTKWMFKHPYEDDFVVAMEEATGLKLTEYFRQWFHTLKRLDYAYDGMSVKHDGDQNKYKIRIKRPGKFVSPIDVAVIWEQGDTTLYTIPPEAMSYAKPGYILMPEWKQFRMPNDRYEMAVSARRKIDKVVIDPFELLLDIDRLNNATPMLNWPFVKLPAADLFEVRLDNMVYDRTPVGRYALRWRPDFWYNKTSGVQLGLHSHGSYLETRWKYSLDLRIETKTARPHFDLTVSNPLDGLTRGSSIHNRFLRSDRRTFYSTRYHQQFKSLATRPDRKWLDVELSVLDVGPASHQQYARQFQISEDMTRYTEGQVWHATSTATINLTTGWLETFRYGQITASTQTMVGRYNEYGRVLGFFESYLKWTIELTNSSRNWLTLSTELLNSSGAPPSQYLHHLSRAPLVDRFTKAPVFRAAGTFPREFEDDFYLAERRVRGYADRTLFITESVGGSLDITPPDMLPYRWFSHIPLIGSWLAKIDQSLFLDMAWVSMDGKERYYPEPIFSNETLLSDGER